MRWAGHVVRVRHRRGTRRVLVVRRDRQWPLARSRRSWEGNIKTDLQEIRLEWGLELWAFQVGLRHEFGWLVGWLVL
jgi:hypothetical protein